MDSHEAILRMKTYTLKADIVFAAEDMTDAFRKLAAHFERTARAWDDTDNDEDVEPWYVGSFDMKEQK
jgi:hypothetical protein